MPLTIPDCQVSFRAVEDRVGNGLTPPRVAAAQLKETLELLVDLDLAANAGLHRVAIQLAQQIVDGIDDTMARVRALREGAPGAER